jgi:hypothetical protein
VITHVWFASNPPVYVMLAERPLPTRLRPEETWEGWADAAALADASNVEGLGRVRLSSGKIIKSRLNEKVSPMGYVAGPGSPEDQIADLRAKMATLEASRIKEEWGPGAPE